MNQPQSTSRLKPTSIPHLHERIRYRIRQFQNTLFARPNPDQLALAKTLLTQDEFHLFQEMQPSEQAHSLQVMDRLQKQGQTHPALLAAALLHDVGKSRQPLAVWQRVVIVLGKALFPAKAHIWGQETQNPTRFKKAFVISAQHPHWGAEMAKQAGSTPLTIHLIQRHQDSLPAAVHKKEDLLLAALQSADDQN